MSKKECNVNMLKLHLGGQTLPVVPASIPFLAVFENPYIVGEFRHPMRGPGCTDSCS
jgi:hypothetical protein